MKSSENEIFAARITDMCERSARQCAPNFTGFMSCEKQKIVKDQAKDFPDVFVVFFGGIEGAERKTAGIFPREVFNDFGSDAENEKEYSDMAELKYMHIKGSGYRRFSHRDILGSLISGGIKKEAVGEIIVSDNGTGAYAVLLKSVYESVKAELERVANDKVSVKEIEKKDFPLIKREYEDLSVTVSSVRLDGIISAALNLSREKTKKLVSSGLVLLNYSECLQPDREMHENDIFSVRGYGKYILEANLGKTGKGRTRLIIKKYK
ncbi:MAG: hypothetical protein J6036_04150 [Clostridia bacterium]|nr:hypothetical protein [Clostridia bacterium]